MDPNETLRLMCATYDDDERREYALALDGWLSGGGFLPDGYTRDDVRGMIRAAITGR